MNNQKGQTGILILAGIVILLAVAGGIFYLGRTIAPSPLPSPTPEASREPDSSAETTNWKTYTNTEHNFFLNYPSNLQIKENDFGTYKSILFLTEYKPPFSNYFNFGLIIYTVKNDTNLKAWLEDHVIQELPSGKKDSIVSGDIMPYKNNNIEGFYFIGGKESVNKYIVFKNDNYIYEISLSGSGTGASYTENPNAEKLLDQILSTFRFTQ